MYLYYNILDREERRIPLIDLIKVYFPFSHQTPDSLREPLIGVNGTVGFSRIKGSDSIILKYGRDSRLKGCRSLERVLSVKFC